MKRFHFQLESVLRLRRHEEGQALEQLANAMRALRDAEEGRDRLQRQIEEAERTAGMLDLRLRAAQHDYLAQLTQRLGLQMALIADREHAVSEARRVAAEAQARRKVLEKLQERQRREWERRLAREEEATLGEVALSRHQAQEER